MGGWARQKLTGKGYGLITSTYGKLFYLVKRIHNKWTAYWSLKKSIVLEGNSKIGIHHKTLLSLKNSKIVINNGTLKVGIDFGYFDGGVYDSKNDRCKLYLVNSTLEIHGNVSLFPGAILYAINATIVIKNGTIINGKTEIISKKGIEIGEDCLFAEGIIVRDNDGHKLSSATGAGNETEEVKIGNHCWIGQRAMILKGVTLNNNTIVGAGAVVAGSFPANVAVAGIPARVIKENVSWNA